MDGLRITYWICLVLVWIELIFVFWLIRKNKKRLKELDWLIGGCEKAIQAFEFAQEAYETKLKELFEEVSDEGTD